MSTRVLVVDDEDTLRTVIGRVLRREGHQVVEAASGEQALQLFRADPFPVVITDIVMGKMSGLDLLEEIIAIDSDTVPIVMTSHASVGTAASSLRCGALEYLIKPFEDLGDIKKVVNRAIQKYRQLKENQDLMARLEQHADELRGVNEELAVMANKDGLTGIFNRRWLTQALSEELERSRQSGAALSLIFMDIDHFKTYNDTNGHLAGDDLLKTISTRIEAKCGGQDVVSRYGGEEFVILLPGKCKAEALSRAETIRRGIESHPFPGRDTQPGGQVTLSLGVSSFPEDGDNGELLLERADMALYAAKNAGRNRVVGWERSTAEASTR